VQSNLPGGLAHARAAIRAGATPAEIAEALALTIMLAGLPKVEVTGIAILQEAEKAYQMVPKASRRRHR
jgi:alkylhydroperoxidase/carboxymuconolactone decarboxylase family protein YurZ